MLTARTLGQPWRHPFSVVATIALLVVATLPISLGRYVLLGGTSARPSLQLPDFGKLPISFEANGGQTDPSVRYLARVSSGTLYFTTSEVVLARDRMSASENGIGTNPDLGQHQPSNLTAQIADPIVVRMQFVNASVASSIESSGGLPGKVNYLLGNDPSKWHTNLSTYKSIVYRALHPGIDLTYTGTGKQLKGTYAISPGADPESIRWRYAGAKKVSVDDAGNLQVLVPAATDGDSQITVTEHAPIAWQEIDGRRIAVSARYLVDAGDVIGFTLGNYDRAHSLTIDPVLSYSTYLGGSSLDYAPRLAVDGSGNAYLTGETASLNFPVVNPYQGANAGGSDVFITKFNPSGSGLVYSTYLGGTLRDLGVGIAVDGQGQVYIAGFTSSTNFPLWNPIQGTYRGGEQDGFVTKLNSSGSALVYSTYLGGSGGDQIFDLAIDGAGNAYVSGETTSGNFPTANAYQPFPGGLNDAFVSKLNAAGSALVYSTYLGGSSNDGSYGLTVDSAGNAYVTGATFSGNFPTFNPYQSLNRGGYDAFLTKFNLAGSGLVYSTYLGGSGTDIGYGVAVDQGGSAYLTGQTNSGNYPTLNPFQATNHGGYDLFVTKLTQAGSALSYSTYLGGSADEGGPTLYGRLYSLVVDGQGNAHVASSTLSNDFPTLDAIQVSNAGGLDVVVTKLNSTGSGLVYSTYLGGSGNEQSYDIAIDTQGGVYVSGWTESTDFPTANPYQSANAGKKDAFIAKISTGSPVPTPTPTRTPAVTPPPCSGCSLRVEDVYIACNVDGTVQWLAVVRNSATCNVLVQWESKLEVNPSTGFKVVRVQSGKASLPPGLTVIEGDFCYVFPANSQAIRVEFSVDSGDTSGGNPDGTCRPTQNSHQIAPCNRVQPCPGP
jgi:hypothetical protein